MRLERIAVKLRRRSAWEALDLGHTMLRTWAPRVYAAWFATYWLAGIFLLLAMWPWPGYAMLVLWWLKPLFDRVLLHVFSRAVFGQEIGVREVLRDLPGLARAPGILSGLTLRRFSFARSLLLPVWQLEEQRGAGARARCRLLSRRCRGHAVWLTFFCANMSSILLVSILITMLALVPGDAPELSIWQWFSDDRSSVRQFFGNLLFMLAETAVEPLYVASGFSLYLNRRSELEAWDIELTFRRMAARRPEAGSAIPLLLVLTLALLMPVPLPLHAAEVPPPATVAGKGHVAGRVADPAAERVLPRSAAKVAIEAVLADPVFGQIKDDWHWRWRQQESPVDGDGRDWLQALVEAIEVLAELLRGLLWIVAGLALAAVAFLVLRYRGQFAGTIQRTAPEFLFGLDLRVLSLPADIAAAARAALANGDTVEALSLLYRGALVALIHERQIEFAAGDTENDCLRRLAGRVPEALERCFVDVVEAWRLTAYARLSIPTARVEELVAGWDRCFGKRLARS